MVTVSLDVANSTTSVLCNGFQSDTITVSRWRNRNRNISVLYSRSFPIPQYNNIFSGLYAGTYDVFTRDVQWLCQFYPDKHNWARCYLLFIHLLMLVVMEDLTVLTLSTLFQEVRIHTYTLGILGKYIFNK